MLHIVALLSGGLLSALIGKLINCGISCILKFFIKIFEIGIDKQEKI